MESYAPGATIRLKGTITDSTSGALTDPTTVVCTVQPASGADILPAVTRQSLGVYTAQVVTTVTGVWYYRFEGTGAAQTAEEDSFYVRPTTV